MDDIDSAIRRWHPVPCQEKLDQFERSNEKDAVIFRKVRDLNLYIDGDFDIVGHCEATDEEIAVYKRTLARKYLLEAHMHEELAKQKRWETQQEFLKVGREVFAFRIYYHENAFQIYFDVLKREGGCRIYPPHYHHINATLHFNEEETECLSESYECSFRKTKFRKLPKEAQLLIEKIKKDIDYVYNLFH